MKGSCLPFLLVLITSLAVHGQGGSKADYERALSLADRTKDTLFHSSLKAHWLADGKSFWYRVQTGSKTHEFVLVTAETGEKKTGKSLAELALPAPAAIYTSKLETEATGASKNGGDEVHVSFINAWTREVELLWLDDQGKPHSYGKIQPGDHLEQNTFSGHLWQVKGPDASVMSLVEATDEGQQVFIDGPSRRKHDHTHRFSLSPNGKWTAMVKDNNVHLLTTAADKTQPLTKEGNETDGYRHLWWLPDSTALLTTRVRRGLDRKVTIVESSPDDQLQPKTKVLDYAKPGDELPAPRPVLLGVTSRKVMVIDDALFPNFFCPSGDLDIRWAPDGSEFFFDYNQRGHQLYRIIGVDVHTAKPRVVVEEKSPTFIDYTRKTWRHWLDNTGELLWMSERDGWCHLWLYDAHTGQVKNQVTHGQWVVRDVQKVDEDRRQVWFTACGLRPGEDPYHVHLCRANFDGSGLVQLTEGDGTHRWSFRPIIGSLSMPGHGPICRRPSSCGGVKMASSSKSLSTRRRPHCWPPAGRCQNALSPRAGMAKPTFTGSS